MKLDRVIAVRNNKTIYRDGDRCVKVFNDDYSKADVLNEALNQARIEETDSREIEIGCAVFLHTVRSPHRIRL